MEIPGICLYKTKSFSISDNVCLSYYCVNHCFGHLDFSGLWNYIFWERGKQGSEGVQTVTVLYRSLCYKAAGGIRDHDELDFQGSEYQKQET